MIDDKVYQSIKYSSDAIEELDVIKSFYVYRLASDKLIDYSSKMYQEYNKLIEEQDIFKKYVLFLCNKKGNREWTE